MGFEDLEDMLDTENEHYNAKNSSKNEAGTEEDEELNQVDAGEAAFMEAVMSQNEQRPDVDIKSDKKVERESATHSKKTSLDQDLAIDTGCTLEDAVALRKEVLKFYKCETCLGFLKGHGFESAIEQILRLGYLPTVLLPNALGEDAKVVGVLREQGGLPQVRPHKACTKIPQNV